MFFLYCVYFVLSFGEFSTGETCTKFASFETRLKSDFAPTVFRMSDDKCVTYSKCYGDRDDEGSGYEEDFPNQLCPITLTTDDAIIFDLEKYSANGQLVGFQNETDFEECQFENSTRIGKINFSSRVGSVFDPGIYLLSFINKDNNEDCLEGLRINITIFNVQCFTHDMECCGNGKCIKQSYTYSCQCNSGYSGKYCDYSMQSVDFLCDPNPCQNNGTCTSNEDSFTCVCTGNWTGSSCETSLFLECSQSEKELCKNGGNCSFVNGTAICICAENFTGPYCETKTTCVPICLNNGTCNLVVDEFTCFCPHPYMGVACEIKINFCESSPCKNGGRCEIKNDGFSCICPLGYAGELCEINTDDCISLPCQNNGTCLDGINSFTCLCTSGYNGTFCEIDQNLCQNLTCLHGNCTEIENGIFYFYNFFAILQFF
uniref:fibropellin-1-like n=1 Tax=Ciona intestinalis TaxID=7719 RepID=UPI000EF48C0C|nr:fibropellin-1-like [Ciona intestinalis]|eukprot:XP_026694539.1 fibropellin-1-like [Ciona intestinalis]